MDEEYIILKHESDNSMIYIYENDGSQNFELLRAMDRKDFFEELKCAIDAKKSITNFEVKNGNVELECLYVDGDDYEEDRITLTFSYELFADPEFLAGLNSLKSRFDEVREETKRNVEEQMRICDQREAFRKTIASYVKTGKAKGDGEYLTHLYEFVKDNKEHIVAFLDSLDVEAKRFWKRDFLNWFIINGDVAFLGDVMSLIMIVFGIIEGVAFNTWFFVKLGLITIGVCTPVGLLSISPIPRKLIRKDMEKIYEELKSYIEKSLNCGEEILLQNEQDRDVFLDSLRKLFEFIKNKEEKEYSSCIIELNRLIHDYAGAKRAELSGETKIDKFAFLRRLIALEFVLKSKDNSISDSLFMSIDDRIKFLGMPQNAKFDDVVLNDIFNTMKRILTFPYDGYETEINELLKIATDYVKRSLSDGVQNDVGITPSKIEATQALAAIENVINKKISDYIDSTKLNNDLSTIVTFAETLSASGEDSILEEDDTSMGPAKQI